MIQKFLLTFVIAFYTLLLGAQLDPNRTYTVAFAQDTLDNDYRFNQVVRTQEYFKRYPNVRFIFSDGKANAALQISQIEDFIMQKVDLIMTSPFDEVSSAPVVAKAIQNGIPVVLVDRTVRGDAFTSYIHPDNRVIAQEAAKYLLKKMGKSGKILLLKGVPKADVTRKRTTGFYDVVAHYPEIEVVERTGNFLRRDAIIKIEELVSAGTKFDAIMSQSDSMLVGARMALEAHDIDPASIITVGIDYIKAAQEAIRSGKQDSSFLYSLCAEESAEIAIKILAGEKVPKEVKLKTVQITKENVDAVKPIF